MIRGLDHFGICAKDIDRSLDFYCSLLGLRLVDKSEGYSGTPEDAGAMGLKSCMVKSAVLEAPDGGQIELLEFESPSGDITGYPMDSIGKLHLAFAADDIYGTMARLKGEGVEFYAAPLADRIGEDTNLWVYFKDPDGNSLELVERTGKVC